MARRFLIVVDYHEQIFGLMSRKSEEFLVAAQDIKFNGGDSITIEKHTLKRTKRTTYAMSMVRKFVEVEPS